MTTHLPPSWSRMSWSARVSYLVNAHYAKDFKAAARQLREAAQPTNQQQKPAVVMRLPYKDSE